MKKLLFLLALSSTTFSCSYDDEGIWNKVEDLNDRLTALESTVETLNGNLSSITTIVNSLESGKIISSVDKIADGYKITFTDKSSIEIKNGVDGSEAPAIGTSKDTDDVYYWTLTQGDDTEFLLDDEGNKLRVTAVTPEIGVDTDGFWTVNTGAGAELVLDENGDKVVAVGKDGDSFFASVEDTDANVVFTLTSGETLTLPKYAEYSLTFANATSFGFALGQSRDIEMTLNNVTDCFILSVATGWTAEVDGKMLKVTAPNESSNANLKVLISDAAGNCKIATVNFFSYDSADVKTLTFEDADYAGTTNYIGESNWTSLVDTPQYYGPLLYGDIDSADKCYQWYDEGNTLLAHDFVNPGENKFWNGGLAVSNYVNTAVDTEIEYTEQLAVPVDNAGKGGNNGSANFTIVNYSAYASAKPAIYFKDGNERIIESVYAMSTSYFTSVATIGNYNAVGGLGADDYVTVTFIGYNKAGEVTNTVKYNLAENGNVIVNDWTKWDLTSLGEVAKVEFTIDGNTVNDWGFSLPSYFAMDDISVIF